MKLKKQQTKSQILLKISAVIIIVFWVGIFLTQIFTIIEKKRVYPLKYYDFVKECAINFGVSESLILATIKVESNFNEKAISNKGAVGLMQIKLETGDYISKLLKEKDYDLLEPSTNIRYGTFYLKYLLDKFNDIETAVCAYNAGEGKVYSWLKNKNYSKNGATLCNVPYKETKNYLNKINKTIKKYNKLYSKILDKTIIKE